MGIVTVGVDVGQVKDPTTVAVCELEKDTYIVRFLQRLPLGTAYPAVAERLAEIHSGVVARLIQEQRQLPEFMRDMLVTGRQLRGVLTGMPERFARANAEVWLFIDATGVGLPVTDLLRDRIGAKNLSAIFLTGGDKCEASPRARQGSVGKAYLVSRLQALIQSQRIVLPETDEARALAEELAVYEIRVSEDSSASFGAFKTGTHDDLVTALGLGCLFDRERLERRVVTTVSRG